MTKLIITLAACIILAFCSPITGLGTAVFFVFAPIIGCLLSGIERKISARMQGRVGPPLLQPYYDVRKLFQKDNVAVNDVESTYVFCALIFSILAGGIFYSGENILLCVFMITLSSLMFIVAAYSSRSPYSEIGAARETIQVMSYEPMILFMAMTFYLACNSFLVESVFQLSTPLVITLLPIFIGILFVLTIKLRKSPFDISMSHHAHQEIVRGMTTEMSGPTLGTIEVMHWYENVLFLGWVGMFFVWSNPWTIVLGVVVSLLVYLFEIFIDNNFARVKWQSMLKWSWIISLIAILVSFCFLHFM